ncbi:carboxymuconolactone decarboxylase family protein [Pectobacterium actinidiae]|uniref:carboxymuconolactone decarboxylase family protein n=1 Tax=Pectobacterium actinidiae TaxID=1507808 RepID=UPI003803A441
MTTHYEQLTRSITGNLAPLRKSVPAVMKGFGDMGKAAMADGALDAKTKELIALAIGVASRCDGCIGFHAKALVKLGATVAEVHEALAVSVYMGGGPAAMYAASAVEAFSEFSDPSPADDATPAGQ